MDKESIFMNYLCNNHQGHGVNVLESGVSSSLGTNDSIIGSVFSNFVKIYIRLFEQQFPYLFRS
jgi:hypothetical protein